MVTTFVEQKKSQLRIPNAIQDLQNLKQREADAEIDAKYAEYKKSSDDNYVELMSQPTKSQKSQNQRRLEYNAMFADSAPTPPQTPSEIIKEMKDEILLLQKKVAFLETEK